MTSADDYKSLAAECVRLAKATQNPGDKALLLAMADAWLKLYEHAKKTDSDPNLGSGGNGA
jgi:hypothetical protein